MNLNLQKISKIQFGFYDNKNSLLKPCEVILDFYVIRSNKKVYSVSRRLLIANRNNHLTFHVVGGELKKKDISSSSISFFVCF